jgi:hypothetical protein
MGDRGAPRRQLVVGAILSEQAIVRPCGQPKPLHVDRAAVGLPGQRHVIGRCFGDRRDDGISHQSRNSTPVVLLRPIDDDLMIFP